MQTRMHNMQSQGAQSMQALDIWPEVRALLGHLQCLQIKEKGLAVAFLGSRMWHNARDHKWAFWLVKEKWKYGLTQTHREIDPSLLFLARASHVKKALYSELCPRLVSTLLTPRAVPPADRVHAHGSIRLGQFSGTTAPAARLLHAWQMGVLRAFH